jgi:hypothetical protein
MASLTDEQRNRVLTSLREWLGEEGLSFFREMQTTHGRVDPVFSVPYGDAKYGPQKHMPHSVHFREGMQVRNFLRTLPETEGWDAHDYDDQWRPLIEAVLQGQQP